MNERCLLAHPHLWSHASLKRYAGYRLVLLGYAVVGVLFCPYLQ